MIEIYNNYKIDENGVVYSKRGVLKTRITKGYVRININQKWVSYARIVAVYLVPNPNHYDKLIYKDDNPLNCKKENLKWVSENKYNMYVYKKQMKIKSLSKQQAIELCSCPILKKYYQTEDISIINDYFLQLNKRVVVSYWREIQGYVYLRIVENIRDYRIRYDLNKYIMSRLHFYKKMSEANKSAIYNLDI